MERLRGGDEEGRERGGCCPLNPWLIYGKHAFVWIVGCVFVYTAVLLLVEDAQSVTDQPGKVANPVRVHLAEQGK